MEFANFPKGQRPYRPKVKIPSIVEKSKKVASFRTPRDIEKRYTRKFKEIILNLPLIDTFSLYKSIDITAEIDRSFGTFMSAQYTFTIKIYAEDYLCYHIIPMQILSKFKNSKSFSNTTNFFKKDFQDFMSSQYPMLRFENITFDLANIIIINQPSGGGAYDFYING